MITMKSGMLGKLWEWCKGRKKTRRVKEAMRLLNRAANPLFCHTCHSTCKDGVLYSIFFVGDEQGVNQVSMDEMEPYWVPSLYLLKDMILSLDRDYKVYGGKIHEVFDGLRGAA
jgi:hypothetical protein